MFHSIKKYRRRITPYLPITAISLQRTLSSVPREAVVGRFDCILWQKYIPRIEKLDKNLYNHFVGDNLCNCKRRSSAACIIACTLHKYLNFFCVLTHLHLQLFQRTRFRTIFQKVFKTSLPAETLVVLSAVTINA